MGTPSHAHDIKLSIQVTFRHAPLCTREVVFENITFEVPWSYGNACWSAAPVVLVVEGELHARFCIR